MNTWTILGGSFMTIGLLMVICLAGNMVVTLIEDIKERRRQNPNWRQERDDE